MAFYCKTGGAFAAPKGIWRKVGDAYVPAKALWRKTGGSWTPVWSARTASINIVSVQQVRAGTNQFYERVTLGITIEGGGTPQSFNWYGDVLSQSATAVFTGPLYDPSRFTTVQYGTAFVDIVIDGQTITASRDFSYTSGDIV